MLDWRAAFATALLHLASVYAWSTMPIGGVPTCLCGPWGVGPLMVFQLANSLNVLQLDAPVEIEPVVQIARTDIGVEDDRCGSSRQSALRPVLVSAPLVEEITWTGPSLRLCVTVNAMGSVTLATVTSTSGLRSVDRHALRAIRQAVFARGRPGRTTIQVS